MRPTDSSAPATKELQKFNRQPLNGGKPVNKRIDQKMIIIVVENGVLLTMSRSTFTQRLEHEQRILSAQIL